jgi:hypothetical protein
VPYSCSAYDDYLAESTDLYYAKTFVSSGSLDFPFATSETDPGKLRYYYNTTSSPTLADAYDGTNLYTISGPSDSSATPNFCSGGVTTALAINHNPTIGTDQIALPDGVSNWGDPYMCAAVFKRAGNISGTLLRSTSKTYRVNWHGSTQTLTDVGPAQATIAIVNTTDIRITATVSAINQVSTVSDFVDIPGVADQLLYVSARITSGAPYQTQIVGGSFDGVWVIVRDITVWVSCNGTSVSVSNSPAYMANGASSATLTILSTPDNTILQSGRILYNSNLSVAYLASGIDVDDGDFTAWQRNYSDYEIPGSCYL